MSRLDEDTILGLAAGMLGYWPTEPPEIGGRWQSTRCLTSWLRWNPAQKTIPSKPINHRVLGDEVA